MFQMLGRKLSDLGMLQMPASRRLHEREKLEIAQIHVDATELAHLVGQGAANTDWLSSKIVVNLGRIEVLETTTSGDRPKGCNATSSDFS
jgi:hypothetical protein